MTMGDKILGKCWRFSGDVSWSDYGGKWLRHAGARTYHVIEFLNWEDACGSDDAGARYNCSLSLVDLDALDERTIASAKSFCDFDSWADRFSEQDQDLALAECCFDYGAKAPLWDENGNNAHALVRQARAESARLRADAGAMADRMSRPVNKLGSTAAEFMRGDLDAAMARGVYAGDAGARLMAKMHGIPDHVIDDARPSDFLPYVMGYMLAMSGADLDRARDDEETAIEYFQGYDRGVRVRAGEVRAPSWIKQAA